MTKSSVSLVSIFSHATPQVRSLTSFPIAMERPPSQGSILTGTLSPDSLYSELSEVPGTEGYITKPSRPRPDAVPDVLFNPVLDHIRELRHPPAPLLHLGNTSAQPTSKLPWIPHGPSVKTRVPTKIGDLLSPVAAARKCSQEENLLSESSPDLMLVSDRVACVLTLLLTNLDMIFSFHSHTPRQSGMP